MQVTPQRRRRSSSGPLARDTSPDKKADGLLEQTPHKLLGRSRSQVFEDETADLKKVQAFPQEQKPMTAITIAEARDESTSKPFAELNEEPVLAETPMISIDGEQYKVLDRAAFAELVGKLSNGKSQPSTPKPKRTKEERSLTELRRQQAAARHLEAVPARSVVNCGDGLELVPDTDVASPGTPPQGQKRRRVDSLERDCESQKQRSPRVRLPALARALAVASGSVAAEPSAAQLERALRNFESFHGLAAGTARADDVANSSAGIHGWAQVSSGHGENSFPRVTFLGPNIAEEMRRDAMCQTNLVSCR